MVLLAFADMAAAEPPDPGPKPSPSASRVRVLDTWRARTDRRRTWAEQRVASTVWLSSSAATLWFDMAGIDQSAALWARDWSGYARDLLAAAELTPEQRRVLEAGIRHYDRLADRRAAARA